MLASSLARAATLGLRGSASLAAPAAGAAALATGRGWRSLLQEYGRAAGAGLHTAFAAAAPASGGAGGEDLTQGKQDMGAFVAGKASSPVGPAGGAAREPATGGGGGGPAGQPLGAESSAGGGYALLAGAHGGLAATCFLASTAVGNFFFPGAVLPQGFETQALVQLLGCGAAAGAAASYALKKAADGNALSSPTAQRLQLGLMGFAAGAVGLHAMYSPAISGTSLLAGGAVMGATFFVPYSDYSRTNQGLKPGEVLRSYFGAIPDHLKINGLSSGLYAALTPTLALAGAAYLLSPGASLASVFGFVKGKEAFFFWQLVGGGLMTVLPSITYSLKKLADEGRLHEPVSKALNAGLLLASAGHLAVFGPALLAGQGGQMLGLVAGAWVAGGASAVLGLLRPGAPAAGARA